MTDLLPLLQEFYREKLADLLRHEFNARAVSSYDANNTYQYIVNREEAQLSWIAPAIMNLGGDVPQEPKESVHARPSSGPEGWRALVHGDAFSAQAFVDRWQPRVDALDHARHRKMLSVVLGEALEQKRFFEQILAGRGCGQAPHHRMGSHAHPWLPYGRARARILRPYR